MLVVWRVNGIEYEGLIGWDDTTWRKRSHHPSPRSVPFRFTTMLMSQIFRQQFKNHQRLKKAAAANRRDMCTELLVNCIALRITHMQCYQRSIHCYC